MSLTLTRNRIKEKCGVADASYDDSIDNLIAEFVPVLEFALEPAHLADASLLPVLNLGAAEVVAGEFLAQLCREPGATEGFSFLGLEVYARKTAQDAAALKSQGLERLAPYLRTPSVVAFVTGKGGAE